MLAHARRKPLPRFLVLMAAAVAVVGLAAPVHAASVTPTPNASWSPWKACPKKPSDNCAVVRAIVRTPGGTVFLGGDFTQLRSSTGASMPATDLAAIDDSGTPVTSFHTHTFNGTIFTLSTDDTYLYVGGGFSKVDGKGALHLAKFTVADGSRQSIKSAINGTVYASVLANGKLYLGGKFSTVQGSPRGNLAALDPATGIVDASWTPAAALIPNDAAPNNPSHNNIPVRALAASTAGDRIYIAGDMDLLNGVARPVLAAVDPVHGQQFTAPGTTFTPPSSINKTFQGMAIAVADATDGRQRPGIILAAGGLTNRAWKLNTDGSIAWTVNTDGDVQAAAVLGTSVYLGGHFTCVSVLSCYNGSGTTWDDRARTHLAAFDYNATSNPYADDAFNADLTPTWDPYYYGVWVLKAYGDSIYAGGVFKNVVVAGTTYPNAKYVRFGPAVAPPPPPPPPPSGSTVFSDDFASNSSAAWDAAGGGMTVSGGVATGALPGKIAYLGKTLPTAESSVGATVKVNATTLDPGNKVVLLRLTSPVPGSAPKGIVDVFVRPNGTLGLRNEVTGVDWGNTSTMSLGTWHTLGLSITVAGTSSTVSVTLDGTAVTKLTGSGNFGTTAVGGVQIGDTSKRAYTISWDDVAVTAGS